MTGVHDAIRSTGETSVARPIFLIGTQRSGATMLYWSLAQHPNIEPILDGAWLTVFSSHLSLSYAQALRRPELSPLAIAGVEIEDYSAHFGNAVNALLLGNAQETRAKRWIDATAETCFHAFGLVRLFPYARFIHVWRDSEAVVEALANPGGKSNPSSAKRKLREQEAFEVWTRTVEACLDVERALGAERVTRVTYDELRDQPEQVIRRCLEFLQEPFQSACLRPFR